MDILSALWRSLQFARMRLLRGYVRRSSPGIGSRRERRRAGVLGCWLEVWSNVLSLQIP